ncbi:hypothetical protein RhiirA5_435491 [Rhizophagus irregularis]|uniref:Uncharacterized protein n=1 Tax=Rhizophagus irregularis TaxID=588596 RepID=A0A2N0NNB4_9GLOM|nr:hypothetical protein RhiirA5_435491 [Rhizophagus irregularis]
MPRQLIADCLNSFPKVEIFIRFLEINGKNLIELNIPKNPDNSLNSVIAKFCPNLSIIFEVDEFETFKINPK